MHDWQSGGKMELLWQLDATLWTGFRNVLLRGIDGSGLCPEVFLKWFRRTAGTPI